MSERITPEAQKVLECACQIATILKEELDPAHVIAALLQQDDKTAIRVLGSPHCNICAEEFTAEIVRSRREGLDAPEHVGTTFVVNIANMVRQTCRDDAIQPWHLLMACLMVPNFGGTILERRFHCDLWWLRLFILAVYQGFTEGALESWLACGNSQGVLALEDELMQSVVSVSV